MAAQRFKEKRKEVKQKLRELRPHDSFGEFTAELRQLEAIQDDLPDSSAMDKVNLAEAKKDFAELKKDFAELKGDPVEMAKAEKDLAEAKKDLAEAKSMADPDNEALKAAFLAAVDAFNRADELATEAARAALRATAEPQPVGGAAPARLRTPSAQKGSSAFTASGTTPQGLGLLGEVPTLLPPHVQALLATYQVDDKTVEGILPKLQSTLVQSVILSKVSETKAEAKGGSDFEGHTTVDRDHIQALRHVWTGCYRSSDHKSKLSLADLNCVFGIATKGSCPDGCLVVTDLGSRVRVVTAMVEGKSTADAPLEAAGQLAVSSSNAVLGQYQQGLDVDKCLVFGMATSGRLVQFYVTFLLAETFPVTAPLSCVLDLASSSGICEAAKYCAWFAKHNSECSKTLRSTHPRQFPVEFMDLDESQYYLKPISAVFMVAETKSASLAHLFRVCHLLQDVPEAVLPLALRTPSPTEGPGSGHPGGALVFERLDGYHMGICSTDFKTFMDTLRHIFDRIHHRNVVHMDLYPSNIMWKRGSDGSLAVRIIDWDAAHIVGQRFSDSVRGRLDDHCAFGHRKPDVIPDTATPFLDVFCLELLGNLSADERILIDGSVQHAQHADLQTRKQTLDDNFRQLAQNSREAAVLADQLQGAHLS